MGRDILFNRRGSAVGFRLRLALAASVSLIALSLSAGANEAGARTDLTVTPKRVTVSTGHTLVTLRKAPFRLWVTNTVGRLLLATREREGLAFTAGPDPELAPPLLDSGDDEPVPAIGIRRYSATRVLSVKKRRGVILIRLATEKSDSKILLRVGPGRSGSGRLSATVDSGGPVSAVSATFFSPRGEAFHGFGARREGTDLRGSDIKSWVLDYRFPDASTGYYAPVPGFISSRRYGVLLGGDRISRWQMATGGARKWRVNVAGRRMNLLVFPGGAGKTMRSISSVTGRHRIPPVWSTGPMLSRTIGILADGDGGYQTRVEADVERILEGDLPVSSYAFEGWAAMPQELVRELVGRLRAKRIRSVLYLRSFVSNDIAGTESPGAYDYAINRGLVAKTRSGAPYLLPSPFPGGTAAVIDFTDPAARKWWSARVRKLLNTGARGFMNDFGEQVLPEMRFADGSTGARMHNRYPVLQARVTRQAVNQWKRRHPRADRVFFFQRAGFSGKPGSAAWENAQFPGDETVDWDPRSGLPSIVPDMLNRAVMGAPGFTTDIGGYAQFTTENPILPPTGAELFTRWSQAAVFTPFFRVHNSGLDGARMPWDFDGATLANWKQMARLHNRARPLTRRLWKRFTRTGVPMTRPLWLSDRTGAKGPRGDDEWLLGPNLLVAPVVAEGATGRPVRLPSGCWRLHGKGRRLGGRNTLRVKAPLTVLPWFTRCGTRPLAS